MSFESRFFKIVSEECAKLGFARPEVAYYQCANVCSAILLAADTLGIPGLELIGCHVKYPKKTSYSEEDGKYAGHYLIQSGSTLYDFTLRQFLPTSVFPFITSADSSEAKKIYRDPHLSRQLSSVRSMARSSQSTENLVNAVVERFRNERDAG